MCALSPLVFQVLSLFLFKYEITVKYNIALQIIFEDRIGPAAT